PSICLPAQTPSLETFARVRRTRPWPLLAALALTIPLTVATGLGSASGNAPPPRAAVVFLQSPRKAIKGKPFIQRIAAIKSISALGYVSSIQGSYAPEQVLLDMSSGARATTSLYHGDLPGNIRLERVDGGGRI